MERVILGLDAEIVAAEHKVAADGDRGPDLADSDEGKAARGIAAVRYNAAWRASK